MALTLSPTLATAATPQGHQPTASSARTARTAPLVKADGEPTQTSYPSMTAGMAVSRMAPNGLTVGADGTLYIPSGSSLFAWKLNAETGQYNCDPSPVATGLGSVTDIAIGADGTLYTSDQGAAKVSIIRPDPKTGQYPTSPTQTITGFFAPQGIAVNAENTLFVTDMAMTQVSVFEPDPKTGLYPDSPSQTLGSVPSPESLAVDTADNLYATASGQNVLMWTRDANTGLYSTDPDQIIGGLSTPKGVTVDTDHTVYVTEQNTNQVSVWRPDPTDGTYPVSATEIIGDLSTPKAVAVGPDHTLFVAEPTKEKLLVWKPGAGGQYPTSPTQTITGPNIPYGVAVDADRTLYIPENTGKQLSVWKPGTDGRYPTNPTQTLTGLTNPTAAAVGADGTVYVSQLGTISSGQQVSVWKRNPQTGAYPSVPDQTITGLNRAMGVAVDQHNTVFISEMYNYRVSVWKPDSQTGTYPTIPDRTITVSGMPNGLAVDAKDDVYVAVAAKVDVWEPDADGNYGADPSATITGLSGAYGVAVDAAGTVYVTEQSGKRVSAWHLDATTEEYVKVCDLDIPGSASLWGAAVGVDDTIYFADGSSGVYAATLRVSVSGKAVSARDPNIPVTSGTAKVVDPATGETAAGPVDLDSDGSFTIGGVPVGHDYEVQIDAPGYETGQSSTFHPSYENVTAPDPIELTPTYRITATITGEAHGTVDASPNPAGWTGTATVTIAPEAGYSIGQVTDAAEADETVTDVTSPVNAAKGVYALTGVDQAHTVTVTFIEGRTVWGTVTDDQGDGVPDAEVSVVKPSDTGGGDQVVEGSATTDDDGDYGVPGIDDGSGYQVQVVTPDGHEAGSSGTFDVGADTADDPVDVTVHTQYLITTVTGTTGTATAKSPTVVEGGSDQVVITPGTGFVIDKVKDTVITDGKTGDPVDVTDRLVDNHDGTFTLTLTDIMADHVVYASFKPGGASATNPGGTTPGGSTGTGTTPGGPGTTTPPPAGPTAVKVKAALDQANLLKGKSYKLVALAYTADGVTVPVTYKSSKAKVATVSASGKVKAKKPGKAIITISSGAQMTKVKITVLKKRPSSAASKVKKVTVKLKKKLKTGQTAYLTPKLGPKTALAVKITFKSTKKKVATIDKAGRLMALKKGKTTITVKAGKTAKKLKLTVK
ncbi:MAG: Ig-like domain-containing protein [Bifidobacteriaceae bacterium]|nr:Ig-like domain-containing protein [Bifidobacteriaceae bacterium]